MLVRPGRVGQIGRTRPSGGTPAPTLPAFDDYGFEYYEDFETARTLHGTNSFEVVTAGQETRWVATGGYGAQDASFRALSTILFGPSGGFPENVRFRLGYNASINAPDPAAYNSGIFTYFLWYVDANNYIRATISTSLSRLSIQRRIAGSNTSFFFQGVTWGPTGILDIYMINGLCYAQIDGKWLIDANVLTYPFDAQVLTAVSAPNRIGRVGINGEAYRWPVAYELGATPIYVTVNDNPNGFARDGASSLGASAIPMSGTYATKTPSQFVYRLRTHGTATVVQDWRAMGSPTFGSGVWSGTISAPTGGPYMADVGFVDTLGKYHFVASRPFSVGALYMYDGQSNSLGRSNPQTITKTDTAFTNKNASAQPSRPAWTLVSPWNTVGTVAALAAAKVASAKMGIPVIVVAIGLPGEALDQLVPSVPLKWARVTTAIANFGKPEGIIWDQGEGDADNVGSVVSTYATRFLTELVAGWRTETANPNLPFLIVNPGRFASATKPGNAATAAIANDRREQLRAQFLAIVAADPLIKLGPAHLGQEHSDDYHYTGLGYERACTRDGYSIAKEFGGISTPDGRGPRVTSASLNGGRDVITLTLDLDGATTLTDIVNLATGTVPTPNLAGSLYGYQVSIDDFASLRTISTIVRSGTNQLVITLSAAAPAGTVKVKSFSGWDFTDVNLFYGTGYADGRADIPVAPMMEAVVAA